MVKMKPVFVLETEVIYVISFKDTFCLAIRDNQAVCRN